MQEESFSLQSLTLSSGGDQTINGTSREHAKRTLKLFLSHPRTTSDFITFFLGILLFFSILPECAVYFSLKGTSKFSVFTGFFFFLRFLLLFRNFISIPEFFSRIFIIMFIAVIIFFFAARRFFDFNEYPSSRKQQNLQDIFSSSFCFCYIYNRGWYLPLLPGDLGNISLILIESVW